MKTGKLTDKKPTLERIRIMHNSFATDDSTSKAAIRRVLKNTASTAELMQNTSKEKIIDKNRRVSEKFKKAFYFW